MPVELRRAGADDAPLLRAVRLRSLAQAPEAFVTTLAEATAVSDEVWRERAVAAGAATETTTMLALRDGEPVGMAGGMVREAPAVISLFGMWVDPAVRGERVGARLVDGIAAWGRERGATRLRLGVMADLPGTARFYERIGFTRVDDAERPLRSDPTRMWVEMARPL